MRSLGRLFAAYTRGRACQLTRPQTGARSSGFAIGCGLRCANCWRLGGRLTARCSGRPAAPAAAERQRYAYIDRSGCEGAQNMTAGGALIHLGYQSLEFIAVGAAVHCVTRLLGFRYRSWSFASARASSLCGIAAILTGWIFISVLFLSMAGARGAGREAVVGRDFDANDVVSQAVLALIAFGPVVLVMRRRRESWASAGVSACNLGRSLAVGMLIVVLCAIFMTLFGGLNFGRAARGLTIGHFWALLQFAIVGFGEEFAFRGYLQIRLMAWLGQWRGWVAASVVMALAHVTQRITMGGLSPLEAVGSSALLIPVSLFSGYVMIRTGNIVAPGLFHTFADWVNTLS
jgi:membrane protease YdiL (CAAX protease family)